MSNSESFWNHPIEKLEEALQLRKQIATLQGRLSNIFGGSKTVSAPKKTRGGRRTMSPQARARIAAAQRARWAKSKNDAAAHGAKAPVKTAGKAGKKKRKSMSPEARAKIAAAAKARWALRKAGGGQ